MAGDEALAGREEDIPGHIFAPTASNRTVYFKGYYISIVNKKTEEQITHEDNNLPSKEYKEYEVPANFTYYVRDFDDDSGMDRQACHSTWTAGTM